jgi:hypothetical protein
MERTQLFYFVQDQKIKKEKDEEQDESGSTMFAGTDKKPKTKPKRKLAEEHDEDQDESGKPEELPKKKQGKLWLKTERTMTQLIM